MTDKRLSLEHIIRNIAEGKFTPSDEPKVSLEHAIRNVHEAIGNLGTDKYQGSQFKNVRSVTPHIKPDQHSQAAETASKMRSNVKEKGSMTLHGKVSEEAESVPYGTKVRRKISIVGRPDDADPKSEKSTLNKLGQIKTKIVDEEKVIPGLTPVVLDPPLLQVSPDGDKLSSTANKPQRDKLKKIVKESIKEDAATSIATKAAGGLGKKLIPGVGAAYGVADAISRAKSGDYVGAGLAGASGVASLVPGVGTAVSAGLDAANIYRDYKAGAFNDTKDEPKQAEPAKAPEPTKPISTSNVNKPQKAKSTIKPFKGFKK